MLFQTTFMRELIFLASSLALLVEKLSSVDLENLLVISERSGNFSYRYKGNPVPHCLHTIFD